MNIDSTTILDIAPNLTERACGGWIAIAPVDCPIRIATVGNTRKDATARFALAMKKWIEILYEVDVRV